MWPAGLDALLAPQQVSAMCRPAPVGSVPCARAGAGMRRPLRLLPPLSSHPEYLFWRGLTIALRLPRAPAVLDPSQST